MDRRKERRITADRPIRLTILGADSSGSQDVQHEGKLLDCSGRGMRVELPVAARPGAALRIDMDDQILLGEVCYCQPGPSGTYSVGLQMEQSLSNLDDLSRLVKALIGEAPQSERAPQRA